jgi:hypothetical protein
MEVEFYLIEHVRFSCGSNLNRIAQFLQYEFSIGLEIPLEVFFQPNRKVVSNDIVNYIENM